MARVRVNRIWQRLFGVGLVAEPDNFGVSGTEATHPALLEWLAVFFTQNEGRTKPLLKMLMSSTVYRQSAMSRNSCQSPRYIPHPVTKVIPPFWETSSSRLSLVLLVLVGKTFPNQFPPWKFESPSGPSTSVVLAAGLATD